MVAVASLCQQKQPWSSCNSKRFSLFKFTVMSTLRNSVQLIGHLGMDPEAKTLNSGTKVANLRIATTERYKTRSGEWKEDTQWHQVTAWKELAEKVEKQLRKGSYIMIEGKLITSNYVDANGNKKYVTEIRANSFLPLDKKQSNDAAQKQMETTIR